MSTDLYSKETLIEKLLKILKNYDPETNSHCLRVGLYTSLFLKYLKGENSLPQNLSSDELLKEIVYAASIHDIGKIYVNPRIIVKGEISSDNDINEIKEHTKIGTLFFDKNVYKTIYEGVLYHHERYDGEGYPFSLKGEEIPIVGRIINIIDSYDAMTTKRPYMASAKTPSASLIEIKENLGTQFDPELGQHFLNMLNDSKYYKIFTNEKNSLEITENLKTLTNWLTSDNLKIEDSIPLD